MIFQRFWHPWVDDDGSAAARESSSGQRLMWLLLPSSNDWSWSAAASTPATTTTTSALISRSSQRDSSSSSSSVASETLELKESTTIFVFEWNYGVSRAPARGANAATPGGLLLPLRGPAAGAAGRGGGQIGHFQRKSISSGPGNGSLWTSRSLLHFASRWCKSNFLFTKVTLEQSLQQKVQFWCESLRENDGEINSG